MTAAPPESRGTGNDSAGEAVVARASAAFTALSLLRSAANVLVLPLLVASLGAAQFSLVVLLTPVLWLSQAVLTLGTNEGLARVAARQRAGISRAVALASLVAVGLALVALVVFGFGSGVILGVPFQSAVALAVAAGCAQAIVSVVVGVLRGGLALRRAVQVLALATLLPPIVGVLAVVVGRATASAYMAGTLAGTLVACLVGTVAVVRHFGWADRVGRAVFGQAVRIGLPVLPALVASLATDAIARRTVVGVGALTDLAVFGVAVALCGVPTTIVKSTYLAWAPGYYRVPAGGEVRAAQTFLARMCALACVLQGGLVAGVLLARGIVEHLHLDADAFARVVSLCAGGALWAALYLATTHIALHRERTSSVVPSAIGGVVLAAGLSVAAAVAFGWTWAAICTPLSNLASTVLMVAFTSRLSLRSVVTPRVLSMVVASTVASFLGWLAVEGAARYVGLAAQVALAATGAALFSRSWAPRISVKRTAA